MGKKNAITMGRNAGRDGRLDEGRPHGSWGGEIRFGQAGPLLVIGSTGAGRADMALLRALAGAAAMQPPHNAKEQK